MELNIRPIGVKDIVPVVAVLKKLDFKEIMATVDASKLATQMKAASMTEEEREKMKADDDAMMGVIIEMAMPVIGVVLDKLDDCCAPLYKWLASMCGMAEKDFVNLPPAAVPEALFEIIHQEGFEDFFKAVRKFLQ